MLTNRKGFTMIELVLVITILGILAVAALPVFRDLTRNAKDAALSGVVGAVRSGINVVYSDNLAKEVTPVWPTSLDLVAGTAAACRSTNLCFDQVIQGGVTDAKWSKLASTNGPWSYALTPAITCTYTYTPATGAFANVPVNVNCP